jgi:hypothetical protein
LFGLFIIAAILGSVPEQGLKTGRQFCKHGLGFKGALALADR